MGSHRERLPLTLHPRISRRLIALVCVMHAAAAWAVVPLPIGLYRLPLLLLILFSAAHALYGQVLMRAPWSIRGVCWHADGSWLLSFASGDTRLVTLHPSTFVSQPLVVLNFRSGRYRRYALPLFDDALTPDVMRRLRQRLRIEGCGTDRQVDPMV